VGVQLLECNGSKPLVAFVSQAQLLRQQGKAMQLEQVKVVQVSLAKSGANDLPICLVDHHLRFQCVPLFLATVESALFFFGRSIGLSVTSTTNTSQV